MTLTLTKALGNEGEGGREGKKATWKSDVKIAPFAGNAAQYPREDDNGQRSRHYSDGEDVTMADESHMKFNNHRNVQAEMSTEHDSVVDNQEREHLKQENEVLREKCLQLEADHQVCQMFFFSDFELTNVAKEIEKERDFYFRKVCEVEELCKSYGDQSLPLLEKIYNSLYQTCDETVEASNENEPPNARNSASSNVLQDSLLVNKNDLIERTTNLNDRSCK
ncbi:hypothetical protein RFI_21535 [Reticulomyxa filosa]|uniref:EB1 C-terminal domain-containing protein n=1 Tax=Reticulomyxa filosa TaxID=46433 RepID=X6MP98_RETFI|nr:hypothetical protein RFI_21535 [Reticulomyxa filosa]|eukprot:ETO15828.1 hypothetical protein RFI_21535 [Reticulomyxa filosa]